MTHPTFDRLFLDTKMKKRREAEFKIEIETDRVPEFIERIRFLSQFYRKFHEVDHYFQVAGDLTNLLRLRFVNNVCILGYKRYEHKNVGGLAVAEEFETEISEPDWLPYVLRQFGIVHLVTVEKERTQYVHNETQTLISVDIVAKLGSFIELEYNEGGTGDLGAIERTLSDVIADLGLVKPDHQFIGYPFLILQREGRL